MKYKASSEPSICVYSPPEHPDKIIDKMAQMLEKLPPECMELLRAIWYRNIRHKVLAEQLGISEDAVKQRHARCKDRLRKLLGEDPRKSY